MEKNQFLHDNKINNEILISKISKSKICVLGIQLNCKAVASTYWPWVGELVYQSILELSEH